MKRILCVLLAVCLLLSGCHGRKVVQDQPTEEVGSSFRIPDAFDTSRKYEITFWAKNDNNSTQRDIYGQAVKDFQAIYPNLTVNLRLYND